MRRTLLLTIALSLSTACRDEDIAPPEVYFDPTARGRLPDGYVFADSAQDTPATDASDAGDVTASDAGDVTASDAGDADQ